MTKQSDVELLTTNFVVDRLEDGLVVLVDGREELAVPKRYFPKRIKEGDVVYLTLATEEQAKKHREKKIKELLNDILKGK